MTTKPLLFKTIFTIWVIGCCILLSPQTVYPQSSNIPLLAIAKTQAIEKKTFYFIDSTTSLPFSAIPPQAFLPFSSLTQPIILNPHYSYWWKFALQNTDTKDSLKVLLCSEDYTHIQLYEIKKGKTQLYQGGDYCNLQNRAFRPNDLCFPINIAPLDSHHYYLKTYDFEQGIHKNFFLHLKTYEQEAIDRKIYYSKVLPKYVFFSLFSGVIIFLVCYSFFHFKNSSDKSFLYYSIYLISTWIYYLRNYEAEIGWKIPILFSYIMEWNKNLEVPIMYLIIICYLRFAQHFLNLKKENPIAYNWLENGIKCFIILIFIDLICQVILGLRTSFTLHHYTRLIAIPFAVYFVFHILFRQKNKLYKYIIYGTLFLLLGALFSVLTKIIPANSYGIWGSAIKVIEMGDFKLYFYGMKIGILLEMICFAFGLSYKNRLQQQKYLQLNATVQSQQAQIKKITISTNGEVQDDFIKELQQLLAQNLENANFGTKELADALHISRSKLYRQLKAKKQAAPSDYIRQFRLEAARILILTTDYSISEISYKTGFKEAAHFSKSFKDFYQISPSDLRLQR